MSAKPSRLTVTDAVDTKRVRMRHEWGVEMMAPRSLMARTLGVVVLVAVLGVVAGCQKSDPVSALKDRASTYWGLKQSKGWAEVYDKFLDPEAKTTVTKEAFLKRRWLAFDILSYRITDVQETGDKAKVAVTNEVNFPLKTPTGEMKFIKKEVTTNDEWVRREGTWYVVLTE